MIIDYDKVQNDVKSLGSITDNDAFLEGFLSAFDFPATTYSRLMAKTKSFVNEGLHIQGKGGIFFLSTTAANLNSELNILKRNDLSKIKEAYIIIVNETELLGYGRDTCEILETSKIDLYRYIEFFFSLLGIKPDSASEEMKSADKKAAEKFASLYNELNIKNPNRSADIAELLCRLLFCCFADSLGVLTNGGLRNLLLSYSETSGSDTDTFMHNLFVAVNSESREKLPGYFANVRFLDSRLFSNELRALNYNKTARSLILELLTLNWADISPDILGALIQSTVREDAGNSCGNYTSTANIQKVIGPLFLNELYRSFEKAKNSREECESLLQRIKAISVLDPSSGAGNFLLVTYRELNKLIRKIWAAIATQSKSVQAGASASPDQTAKYGSDVMMPWTNFYGIEEDSFSCSIARLGFLFVVCQEACEAQNVQQVFTDTIEVLFSGNIVNRNATRIDWESVCSGNVETYLIGNPPYSGGVKKSDTQKTDIARIFREYKGFGNLDYAACWFLIAAEYIRKHGCGFAFVTTNSLAQGEQVQLLWPKIFEKDVHIRFAHTSFKWRNDARNRTAVTVVIIGVVPNTNTATCELFTSKTVFEPKSISPYLIPETIIIKKRSTPISGLPKMVKGNMPLYWSEYLLSHEEMLDVIEKDPRTKKYLRRLVGGDELINGIERWCYWIHDCDVDDAMSIPAIAKSVELVYKARLSSADASARKHAAHPYRFREQRETRTNSLVIPEVSSENREYLQIGFTGKNIIVSSTNYVIYDCPPWLFGVISSKMHNLWIRTVCGALETRIRYSPRLGYNTFPFPRISSEQQAEILKRVLAIIASRELYPSKTFAELYEPDNMPDELSYAHFLLDCVIDRCYRDAPFVSDQDRLESLFELYNKFGG